MKVSFLNFLQYAHASNDETIDHLENLFETGSLQNEEIYKSLHKRLDVLGQKINRFIHSVEKKHISSK